MEDPLRAAYAAPGAELAIPSSSDIDASAVRRAARAAGWFVLAKAWIGFAFWAYGMWSDTLPRARAIERGPDMLLPLVLPGVIPWVINTVLAVPLVRGSRRFRVVTLAWTALTWLPLVVTLLFIPNMGLGITVGRLATVSLYVLALVILLFGRPTKGRWVLAITCITGHAVLWTIL